MSNPRYNPAVHRVAVATAVATFPLIFMGGLVTSHQAGMAVPDWPNSYGYNMFLFPISMWKGGIFYEHTHRLMATVVGFLSIILTIVAWRSEPRRWVRWLATGVLGAVIFQGVLGGLRVVLIKLDLAVVHACVAQAFFCLASFTAAVTSKWWINAPDIELFSLLACEQRPTIQTGEASLENRAPGHCSQASRLNSRPTTKLVRAGIVACLIIYLQLIAGAVMRHYRAGLAIPDLPLAYGKLLPPTDAAGLARANHMRTFPDVKEIRGDDIAGYEQMTSPVTLTQIWVHFTHRVGAVCVTIAVLTVVVMAFRRGFVAMAGLLTLLLLAQLTLGVLTVLLLKPADIASAHVAVGALTLVTTFLLTVRAWRVPGHSTTEIPDSRRRQPAVAQPNTLTPALGSSF